MMNIQYPSSLLFLLASRSHQLGLLHCALCKLDSPFTTHSLVIESRLLPQKSGLSQFNTDADRLNLIFLLSLLHSTFCAFILLL